MDNTFFLKRGTSLFRYDLTEPPSDWSTEHCNVEYEGSIYGKKNAMSAFFFFNSEEQAIKTGEKAIGKEHNTQNSSIWITTCVLDGDVKLLDLRRFYTIVDLLSFLIESGYDILSSRYKAFFNQGIGFDRLKDLYMKIHKKIRGNASYYQDSELMNEIIPLSEGVEKFLHLDIRKTGAFVQLITDYSNGTNFKEEVKAKGYEGIIFNETIWGSKGTDTICVFSASKFSLPIKYLI